jgi:hypothetical protein
MRGAEKTLTRHAKEGGGGEDARRPKVLVANSAGLFEIGPSRQLTGLSYSKKKRQSKAESAITNTTSLLAFSSVPIPFLFNYVQLRINNADCYFRSRLKPISTFNPK